MSIYRSRRNQVGGASDMKDRNNNNRNGAQFVDFDYDKFDPNVFMDDFIPVPVGSERAVASVTVDRDECTVVSLNGVVGLDNDANAFRSVIMRIYRGNGNVLRPDQVIYEALIEIHAEGQNDVVVEPFAHVDDEDNNKRKKCRKNHHHNDDEATYTLTLEADGNNVFLTGPLTFTAMAINK